MTPDPKNKGAQSKAIKPGAVPPEPKRQKTDDGSAATSSDQPTEVHTSADGSAAASSARPTEVATPAKGAATATVSPTPERVAVKTSRAAWNPGGIAQKCGPPPALPEDINDADLAEIFYALNQEWVKKALPVGLGLFGIPVADLHRVPPSRIEDNAAGPAAGGGVQVTTFREPWNLLTAKMSMETTRMHESNGTLYWFDEVVRQVNWNGECLFDLKIPYKAVEAAKEAHWSMRKLIASHTEEQMRRLIFPGHLPTACVGISCVEQCTLIEGKSHPYFYKLPLFAGRAVVLSLWLALRDRLVEIDALQCPPLAATNDLLIQLYQVTTPKLN